MERNTVDGYTHADDSAELGEILFLQVAVRIKPDSRTSSIATSCKVVVLSMSWQQGKVVELDYKQTKIVSSRRMMGRRAARQTAAILLSFAGGDNVLNACLFVCRFLGGKYSRKGERTDNFNKRTNLTYEPDR